MPLTKITGGEFDNTQGGLSVAGIITATGGFIGTVTGNVTGAVSGNVTGNVIGNVTGNVTGNLVPSSGVTINSPASNTLAVVTNNIERIRVGAAGSIGIGTDNPTKLIDMSGVHSGINTTGRFVVSPHSAGWDTGVTSGSIHHHYADNFRLYSGQIGSGTERFKVDSSGRVTTPYQVYFYARPSTSINQTSGTLQYSAVDYNVGNHYNSSTYTFTAPVAGVYCISFQFFSLVNAAGGADLEVNGTLTMRCGREGTETYYEGYSNSINKYLNVNDTVRAQHYNGTVHLNTPYSHFSAYLLG